MLTAHSTLQHLTDGDEIFPLSHRAQLDSAATVVQLSAPLQLLLLLLLLLLVLLVLLVLLLLQLLLMLLLLLLLLPNPLKACLFDLLSLDGNPDAGCTPSAESSAR